MSEETNDDGMLDDLHEGVEALRSLSRESSHPLSEKAVVTMQRLEQAVPAAKQQARRWRHLLKEKALAAAQRTDDAVHRHPWLSTLGALGLGFLAGYAITVAVSGGDEDEGDGAGEAGGV